MVRRKSIDLNEAAMAEVRKDAPMSSEMEKAKALVSRSRDILKDAWSDLEAELEDQEDGKTIADRLIAAYDLQPFLLSNGRLGIHFMNLSYSDDSSETLIEQVREEIDACSMPDGLIGEQGEREHLQEWRNTLAEALSAIDSALRESDT